MSTFSLNTTVITESPNLEILLVSSIPGTLAILCSIGKVTSCSTSCPASRTYGNNLYLIIGDIRYGIYRSFVALHTPQITSKSVIIPITILLLILNLMILSNTDYNLIFNVLKSI